MLVKFKNIGRFYKDSLLEINGITVLAGMNGTGKSTIGKLLYCIYNSLYDYKSQAEKEREYSLYRIIRLLGRDGVKNLQTLRNRISDLVLLDSQELTRERILSELATITGIKEELIDKKIVDRVCYTLTVSTEDILNSMFNKRITSEFDSQVGHVNYPDEMSEIEVHIKDSVIRVDIDAEGKAVIRDKIEILKDLVYIDDPYVIDEEGYLVFADDYSHREDVKNKLKNRDDNSLSAIDDLLNSERLKQVYEIIDKVCGGYIDGKEDEYGYVDKKLKKKISVRNLSTGMKSFVVLKTLLSKGYLEEDGMVILDEPEAHLHPEWMILYAEIVVLLQKELGINFVISTHSSEFISYLEVFTRKFENTDRCKYYLLQEAGNDLSETVIQDCTDSVNDIYDVLTRPYIWASRELD